jgi:hypothetical protein
MKRRILIFWCAMVGVVPSFQVLMLAQNRPSNLPGAISADPPRDAANPTRNKPSGFPATVC